MISGKLTKLSRNKNDLRTNSMEGVFSEPPTIGKRFAITGKPLTKGASIRLIDTSVVQSVEEEEDGWRFQTENSKYRIRRLK